MNADKKQAQRRRSHTKQRLAGARLVRPAGRHHSADRPPLESRTAVIVARRMHAQTVYRPELYDWLSYVVLPLAAHAVLPLSALAACFYPVSLIMYLSSGIQRQSGPETRLQERKSYDTRYQG